MPVVSGLCVVGTCRPTDSTVSALIGSQACPPPLMYVYVTVVGAGDPTGEVAAPRAWTPCTALGQGQPKAACSAEARPGLAQAPNL